MSVSFLILGCRIRRRPLLLPMFRGDSAPPSPPAKGHKQESNLPAIVIYCTHPSHLPLHSERYGWERSLARRYSMDIYARTAGSPRQAHATRFDSIVFLLPLVIFINYYLSYHLLRHSLTLSLILQLLALQIADPGTRHSNLAAVRTRSLPLSISSTQ